MRCLTYYVVSISGEHVAMCTCGWLSRGTATSGLAGALWDAHMESGAGATGSAAPGTEPVTDDEPHEITDLMSVGPEGAVTCRCGWSGRAKGSRSDLLDRWVAHVEAAEDSAGRLLTRDPDHQ